MGTRLANPDFTEIATIDSPPMYAGPYVLKPSSIDDSNKFHIFHGDMDSLSRLRKETNEIPGFSRINKSNGLVEYINQIPTIDTLLLNKNMTVDCSRFGYLNEVEYSANIKCVDLRFPYDDSRILMKIRYYFENLQTIFINENQISTDYLICDNNNDNGDDDDYDGGDNHIDSVVSNCSSFRANVVTRLDYENGALSEVTAKFKVVTEKFIYDNCRYSLTGSIEVPMDELKTESMPIKYSRKRYFRYWNISLNVPKYIKPFIFRIAFRNEKSCDDSIQTCNIECEDLINGVEFIKCFDLLFKYYKHMYKMQNHLMTPEFLDKNDLNDAHFKCDLNDDQVEILKTLKHINYYFEYDNAENLDNNKPKVSPDMMAFVKYMGFNTYRMYYPEHEDLQFLTSTQLKYEVKINSTQFDADTGETTETDRYNEYYNYTNDCYDDDDDDGNDAENDDGPIYFKAGDTNKI
ncbi:GrBNV_gp43-like protein [Drosophila innubila nudivirus]|uniref:GrBNV_gp43-like protein n=1 Tax=Drosophila innubila nudivirus TaxID=2057187 RepID=A0A2H4UXD4_9VIRU|nr:GrBNV_gp43-like protein [Drosophila innubila nudivirus]ATZ81575.1 GrBNV_gp43-like protein [Drosophila innubila nudivirus]